MKLSGVNQIKSDPDTQVKFNPNDFDPQLIQAQEDQSALRKE